MLESDAYAFSLAAVIVAAVAAWALSVVERDVSIVDVLWGPMFLIASLVFAALVDERGPRAVLVIALTAVWAMRLSGYIAWRKLGEPEDRRYEAIRRRNEPHFAFKSLYLVFGLQAGLAWIVSLPLLASVDSPGELGVLDYAGAAVWITGLAIEAIADWQLARFKADARSRGRGDLFRAGSSGATSATCPRVRRRTVTSLTAPNHGADGQSAATISSGLGFYVRRGLPRARSVST
jgi:steroid 5-alpha reductase family enzyme